MTNYSASDFPAIRIYARLLYGPLIKIITSGLVNLATKRYPSSLTPDKKTLISDFLNAQLSMHS